MAQPVTQLRSLIENLPLRLTIAIALIVGLSLPIVIAMWRGVAEREENLLADLRQDHAMIVETLAIGMQTPIWDVRPDTGRPLLEAIMRDERVSAINVSSPIMPEFLSTALPHRRTGDAISGEAAVVRNGKTIGTVSVEMNTAPLRDEIERQRAQVAVTGILQLALGMLIIFPLLGLKVLRPINRLLGQSRALAAGRLDQPFFWRGRDEIGQLGSSFDDTRQSLRRLFTDLETRNAELLEREIELSNQTSMLRATLDNMTDGITLIEPDLKISAWNARYEEVMDFPPGLIRKGAAVGDLVRYDLEREAIITSDADAFLVDYLRGFRIDRPYEALITRRNGKSVQIRRRPIPTGGFVTTYTDISEQVAARRQVEQTLRLLEAVMDAVPAAILVKDRDLRYQMVNRHCLEFYQLSPERIIGKTTEEAFDAAFLRDYTDRDPEVLATGEAVPFYDGILHPAGREPIRVLTTKVPLRDADGRISHTVTVDLDVTELKRAEQALRESEEFYRELIEAAPYGIILHDEAKIRFINPAGCNVLGLPSPATAIGRPYIDFVRPGEKQTAFSRMMKILDESVSVPPKERHLIRLDGDEIIVSISGVPFKVGAEPLAFVMFEDVTEVRHIEQERQRWLQLFEDAIESLPNGFAVFDANERVVICNRAFAQPYRMAAKSLVGQTFAQLLPRFLSQVQTSEGLDVDDLDIRKGMGMREYWTGKPNPITVEFKDGRWMLINRHPTAEGGLVIIRTDVTDLKRMQAALAESEHRFRGITETNPVPVVIWNGDDKELIYASPGFADLVDVPLAQLPGRAAEGFFADASDHMRLEQTLRRDGLARFFETRFRRADGGAIDVSISAKPITYEGREGVLASILDLTERKKAELELERHREALHQSEKMSALGSLLAGVAHELNNPLSVVVGRSIMLEDSPLDPRVDNSVKKIRKAAERCVRIVRAFLAMARQQAPSRERLKIHDIISSSLDLVVYGLRSAGIEVERDVPESLPDIMADPGQMGQVFTNLFINAQQAMADQDGPRVIRVEAFNDADADMVVITITDNGPGIPRDVLPRVFEPFFTTKPAGVGTGIGLSICYGIVEAHGGTISVDLPEEVGTRFTIALPVLTTAAPSEPEMLAPLDEGKGRNILVVDDEDEVAGMLREILATEGHRVAVVGSGREALDAIGRQRFDLVLSDLIMPNIDGPGLYRALERRHPEMIERLMFITGDTLSAMARNFLGSAERPVIEKPFVPSEVRRLVRDFFERFAAEAADHA